MNCPYCNTDSLDAEFVDIGVGRQQVTPYECSVCGAYQTTEGEWFGGADEAGIQVMGLNGNEIELKLDVNGHVGYCYMSKEMYEAIGKLWK